CSRSRSLGTTYNTDPRGIACAAPATYSAFAGGVSPETARAGASIPLRRSAVLKSARRFREVDVVIGTQHLSVHRGWRDSPRRLWASGFGACHGAISPTKALHRHGTLAVPGSLR